MKDFWTPARIAFVKDNAGILDDAQVAEALGRITGKPVKRWEVARVRAKVLGIGTRRGPLAGGKNRVRGEEKEGRFSRDKGGEGEVEV